MSISRIIAAIQRTSHLTDRQMRRQFREIFRLRFEEELRDIHLQAKLEPLSFLSVRRGTGCWVNPYYEKIYVLPQQVH